MRNYQIAASLLSANFARLGEDAKSVLDAGADLLHFDAMDNHFVPNLTIGPLVCAALRRDGIKARISVHLMVEPVDRLIVDFAKAGATGIIFHPEATQDITKSLNLIREHGCCAGLALNPETSPDILLKHLNQIDNVLVMSVHPGFGGQKFIKSSLDKIKQIRQDILDPNKSEALLSVDGGVNIDNIGSIAQAGADTFVSGSGIFKNPPYADVIMKMRAEISKVK